MSSFIRTERVYDWMGKQGAELGVVGREWESTEDKGRRSEKEEWQQTLSKG